MRWSQYIHLRLDFCYFGSSLCGSLRNLRAEVEQFRPPHIEWLSLPHRPFWKRDRLIRLRICGGGRRPSKIEGGRPQNTTPVPFFFFFFLGKNPPPPPPPPPPPSFFF